MPSQKRTGRPTTTTTTTAFRAFGISGSPFQTCLCIIVVLLSWAYVYLYAVVGPTPNHRTREDEFSSSGREETGIMAGTGTSVTPESVASVMLRWHGLELAAPPRRIQTLWAGYGSISEVQARPIAATTTTTTADAEGLQEEEDLKLILKLVTPPDGLAAAGRAKADEGHARKMLSYEVEQYFYEAVAPRLTSRGKGAKDSDSDDPPPPAVARCIATTRGLRTEDDQEAGDRNRPDGTAELLRHGVVATLIEDLRPAFPVEPGGKGARETLDRRQVRAALDWLAAFHGLSRAWVSRRREDPEFEALVRPPLEEVERRRKGMTAGDGDGATNSTVWLNGGYTYLATRRKEYAALEADVDSEWSSALCAPSSPGGGRAMAERVAEVLRPRGRDARPQESYVHGDVKSENLFATTGGDRVAFFDFQYVGLGLGVCDLAKLFTCSVPLGLLTDHGRDTMPQQLAMDAGERGLLEEYRARLLRVGGGAAAAVEYGWALFVRHWEAALVDWLRFQMSWGAWGNTEWLEARVRSILSDDEFKKWLLSETT